MENEIKTAGEEYIRGLREICAYLKVSPHTVYEWHRNDPTFRKAVTKKMIPGRTRATWFAHKIRLGDWMKSE